MENDSLHHTFSKLYSTITRSLLKIRMWPKVLSHPYVVSGDRGHQSHSFCSQAGSEVLLRIRFPFFSFLIHLQPNRSAYPPATRIVTMSASPETTIWPQLAIIAAVSASHMSMPNHWLPYSLVARAHGWSLQQTLLLSKLAFLVSSPLCYRLPGISECRNANKTAPD